MIVVRHKKEIQVLGAGDPVITDETYNYYITSGTASAKRIRRKEIIFTGTKQECKQYVDNLSNKQSIN